MESGRFLWRALWEEAKLIAFRFDSNIPSDHQPLKRCICTLSTAKVKRDVQDPVAGLSRAIESNLQVLVNAVTVQVKSAQFPLSGYDLPGVDCKDATEPWNSFPMKCQMLAWW